MAPGTKLDRLEEAQPRHSVPCTGIAGSMHPTPTALTAWGLTGLPSEVFPYPRPVTGVFSCHRDVAGAMKIRADEDIGAVSI